MGRKPCRPRCAYIAILHKAFPRDSIRRFKHVKYKTQKERHQGDLFLVIRFGIVVYMQTCTSQVVFVQLEPIPQRSWRAVKVVLTQTHVRNPQSEIQSQRATQPSPAISTLSARGSISYPITSDPRSSTDRETRSVQYIDANKILLRLTHITVRVDDLGVRDGARRAAGERQSGDHQHLRITLRATRRALTHFLGTGIPESVSTNPKLGGPQLWVRKKNNPKEFDRLARIRAPVRQRSTKNPSMNTYDVQAQESWCNAEHA